MLPVVGFISHVRTSLKLKQNTETTVCVKKSPLRFLTIFFSKQLGIFNQFLHTYYTFLSTLDDKFLLNYFQP